MQIIPHQQGTQGWLDARKGCDTASEAPAAAGVSKYQKRQDLIHIKATGIDVEHDAATQAIFAKGHLSEADGRQLAEEILGEELFPITAMVEFDGLKLLASLDGLTIDERVAFEHKLYSESLAEQIRTGNIEPHYTVQMDQQCFVTGAKKVLFMTSNGTKEKMEWCWYEPTKESLVAVVDTWKQFHKDLADFVPREINARPVAEQVEAFPVPSIQVRGELVACNLADITPVFDRFLTETNTDLKTDQQFAQGEEDAKASREAAKTCKLKAKEVIDQIAPVSEVVRTLETYAGKFDALGLKLEKAVKEQKDIIKTNIALEATGKWHDHIAALEKETHPIRMVIAKPDFGAAMKSMRTIASLHNAADTALANAKAEAEGMARDIRAKLAWCKEHADGYGFLFSDLQQIIYQPAEAFQIIVQGRVEQHKKAEAERLEQERQRIQAEEQAKADQRAKPPVSESESIAPQDQVADRQSSPPTIISDAGATIKLGSICERLGFMVTADFLRSLGIEAASRERNAILYRESDMPRICNALIRHIENVRDMKQAA